MLKSTSDALSEHVISKWDKDVAKPRNHCLNVRVYLHTLPPVRNAVPRSKIKFPVSLLMKSAPQPAGQVPEPDYSNKVKYDEYLVTMAGSIECQTPAKRGKPLQD